MVMKKAKPKKGMYAGKSKIKPAMQKKGKSTKALKSGMDGDKKGKVKHMATNKRKPMSEKQFEKKYGDKTLD